jgi:hypothetical protein
VSNTAQLLIERAGPGRSSCCSFDDPRRRLSDGARAQTGKSRSVRDGGQRTGMGTSFIRVASSRVRVIERGKELLCVTLADYCKGSANEFWREFPGVRATLRRKSLKDE